MSLTIPTAKTYTIDDLQSDLGHLRHLVDTVADVLTEDCDFAKEDGTRLRGMDRLNGLIWVARDMVSGMEAIVEKHYFEIATSRCIDTAGAK